MNLPHDGEINVDEIPATPALLVFVLAENSSSIATAIIITTEAMINHPSNDMNPDCVVALTESFLKNIPEPITDPTTRAMIDRNPYLLCSVCLIVFVCVISY
jgi:hypothetical protein